MSSLSNLRTNKAAYQLKQQFDELANTQIGLLNDEYLKQYAQLQKQNDILKTISDEAAKLATQRNLDFIQANFLRKMEIEKNNFLQNCDKLAYQVIQTLEKECMDNPSAIDVDNPAIVKALRSIRDINTKVRYAAMAQQQIQESYKEGRILQNAFSLVSELYYANLDIVFESAAELYKQLKFDNLNKFAIDTGDILLNEYPYSDIESAKSISSSVHSIASAISVFSKANSETDKLINDALSPKNVGLSLTKLCVEGVSNAMGVLSSKLGHVLDNIRSSIVHIDQKQRILDFIEEKNYRSQFLKNGANNRKIDDGTNSVSDLGSQLPDTGDSIYSSFYGINENDPFDECLKSKPKPGDYGNNKNRKLPNTIRARSAREKRGPGLEQTLLEKVFSTASLNTPHTGINSSVRDRSSRKNYLGISSGVSSRKPGISSRKPGISSIRIIGKKKSGGKKQRVSVKKNNKQKKPVSRSRRVK